MLELLIMIVLVGLIVYLAETYIPMSPPFKTVLRVVVVIILIFWLIQFFGIAMPHVKLR